MTKLKAFLLTGFLAAASFGAVPSQRSTRIWSAGFGPTRDVRVSTPRFVWQVWPEGDAKITSATITINGKDVEARYDTVKKELFFVMDRPLAPGTYQVEAKVKVDDWAKFDKKWSVTIRPDAVTNKETVSADAEDAIEEFNRIRLEHGFAPCRFDSSLNLASTAHTKYLALNKGGGHGEDPEKPGFTGMDPVDRVGLFGHVGSSWEIVSMGGPSAMEAIHGLWDAPYHRINMMMPGPGIVGASFKDKYFTMDGDGTKVDGVYVSPPENGKEVTSSWSNHEFPSPTRKFPDANTLLGYPVVMNVYGDDIKQVSILYASFTSAAGKDVDCYELSGENDEHLSNSVILLPKKPLEPGTVYSVRLKVKDNKGNTHEKSWKFRTAK